MRFLTIVLLSLIALYPASASSATAAYPKEGCELEALQINESTALLVISRSPPIMEKRINEKSDSLLLQLFLWGALEGDKRAITWIGEVGVNKILDRDDNALTRLLWILAQNNDPKDEYSGVVFTQDDLDVLNKWANKEVQRNPRNMFTAMMSKARRFGGGYPSLLEFQLIDVRIRDPETLFHMAGLLSDDDKYREAYALLKEAAEGGEWRAFLGLAIIEKSKLKNCAERAQVSYRVFSSISEKPRQGAHKADN